MLASGSMPLPPIPVKKTGESIIAAALLDVARIGQHHAKRELAPADIPWRNPLAMIGDEGIAVLRNGWWFQLMRDVGLYPFAWPLRV
jgi:hypothetical protein